MILDTIANAARYAPLHPLFAKVFAYMRDHDLHALPNGRHALSGDLIAGDVFAIVERVNGRTRADAQLECHRKYIDIQLVLAGSDEMGWKPLADCQQPVADYHAEHDIQFFHDTADAWITTPAGAFCIFFPEDAHAPLVSQAAIHKIVFKIAVHAGLK
jgi:biofilm protein TabA